MQLTTAQIQAIEKGETVEVDVNGHKCAVMPWEVYEQVNDALTNISPIATAALIREMTRDDDADDALLESYQHYRSNP